MVPTTIRDAMLAGIGADPQYFALVMSITDWDAGTFTEASYTGYAASRPSGNTEYAAVTGGRTRRNAAQVNWGQNTGGSTVSPIGWAWMSAASGGTLRALGLFNALSPFVATVNDTGDLLTAYAHGMSADQRVFVHAAPGVALPTGLSENTIYWVRSTGLTADAFTLSTTQGGAAVAVGSGAAIIAPFTPLDVANLATPQAAAGALAVDA